MNSEYVAAQKPAARLLVAGTGSGCGKTTVVCALLQALVNRGLDAASFKCGPDYIDPMFHSEIIGSQASNIDLFFAGEELARALFVKRAARLNVIEGVMGYYDGLSMDSEEASSWHVAWVLSAPTVLVVNGRGMALSAAAVVKGFQTLRSPGGVRGVIFNRVSAVSYPRLKETVEKECGVPVFGFLPENRDWTLESRHLGLVTAQEVGALKEKMQALAAQAEKTLDIDGLVRLMESQPPLSARVFVPARGEAVRVAVARDRAFCFYYRDNLELLQEMGAEIVEFSPLAGEVLPTCHGLILGGGYPELYAEELSRKKAMLASIREAVLGGLPTIAECGGFMLLTQSISGRGMAGVLPGNCHNTGKLARFGYATLTSPTDNLLFAAGDSVRAHEFHYWDADDPGGALAAAKPSGREWKCAHVTDTLYAGFPHLYFPSAPKAAERFLQKCRERKMHRETHGN